MTKKNIFENALRETRATLKIYLEEREKEESRNVLENIFFGELMGLAKILNLAFDEEEDLKKECSDMLDKLEKEADIELNARLCE